MGKLFLVGIGPGNEAQMTGQAKAVLNAADVLCGYTAYIELIRNLYPEKEFYDTPMMREMERCRHAVRLAQERKNVAMLCSGDAGVYGMAAPCLQLAENTDLEIEIVPGVSAALSGAAVLGAPLNHDFCVISLSDLLTPWTVIERRLKAAAEGDFAVCLYNPMSRRRRENLSKACEILLTCREPGTPCGWVRNIGREGQEHAFLSLAELKNAELDMFTTVFIGNSSSRMANGRMVTPRGYEEKYGCTS